MVSLLCGVGFETPHSMPQGGQPCHFFKKPTPVSTLFWGIPWLLSEMRDLEAHIHLPSITCDLALSEVYAKVRFDA